MKFLNSLRGAWRHLLRYSFALLALWIGGFSMAAAAETVEAYWGSFGERMGRIEGVILKRAGTGMFIGFDEEREIAAFSADVEWDPEGKFVFEGISNFGDSDTVVPTAGGGRTLGTDSGVLLESNFQDTELRFEAFIKTSAHLEHFNLEGEIAGDLYVVLAEGSLNYALFVDQAGGIIGGNLRLEESTGTLSFRSKRGDQFDLPSGSTTPSYVLSDGRRGKLRVAAVSNEEAVGSASVHLKSVWSRSAKTGGAPADALHFIIEGEGELAVELNALVSCDMREVSDLGQFDSADIELYRLDENDRWQMLFSSLPVSRLKSGVKGEFEWLFSGRLPTMLPRGTYLVQVANLFGLPVEVETRATFAQEDLIGAINGSSFYHRGPQNLAHRFGFQLAGGGLSSALVRSVGPGLSYFGVSDCTEDPALTIYRQGLKSWRNENWEANANPDRIAAESERMGAFPLSRDSEDAAMMLSIGEGVYEVESRRDSDDSGFEIIELYLSSEGS